MLHMKCVCVCVFWGPHLKVSVTLRHLCESKILGCVLYLSGHDLSLTIRFAVRVQHKLVEVRSGQG